MNRKNSHLLAAAFSLIAMTIAAAPSQAADRILNENSAGKTYAIKVGSTFHLVLNSTYWSLTPLKSSAPIKLLGEPVVAVPSMAPGMPPGMGRGTVDWAFRATRPGAYTLAASRTSCGEAMRCVGDQGSFSVRLKVAK
jgi:hypothetical protein